ncbi:MAG: hypothetical protein ACLQO1_25820 [Steroidobacteraceae bacterium]
MSDNLRRHPAKFTIPLYFQHNSSHAIELRGFGFVELDFNIRNNCGSASPPLDLALDRLNLPRLKRLAKAMDLRAALEAYLSRKDIFDRDPDVQANNAVQSV